MGREWGGGCEVPNSVSVGQQMGGEPREGESQERASPRLCPGGAWWHLHTYNLPWCPSDARLAPSTHFTLPRGSGDGSVRPGEGTAWGQGWEEQGSCCSTLLGGHSERVSPTPAAPDPPCLLGHLCFLAGLASPGTGNKPGIKAWHCTGGSAPAGCCLWHEGVTPRGYPSGYSQLVHGALACLGAQSVPRCPVRDSQGVTVGQGEVQKSNAHGWHQGLPS